MSHTPRDQPPQAVRSATVWVAKLHANGTWEFIPAGTALERGCQRITTTVELPMSYATPRDQP